MPYYLLLPFFASILLVFAALYTKRAVAEGYSPWRVTLIGNLLTSLFFSTTWWMGGEIPPLILLWQPALVGLLFLIGQTFILLAVTQGDVSIALPVASIKVVFVTILLSVTAAAAPSTIIWIAVGLSVAGVFLINTITPPTDRRLIAITMVLALTGAATFAVFDICLQHWSQQEVSQPATSSDPPERLAANAETGSWPPGRMLPFSSWFMALFSLLLLPRFEGRSAPSPGSQKRTGSIALAAGFVSLQATLMCLSLSLFGDAARINVVYSLRGLWGVVLAWVFAKAFDGREATLPSGTMVARLAGAVFLIAAVVLVILAGDP